MGEVRLLKTSKALNRESAEAMLWTMLERASKGELQSVAVAALQNDGTAVAVWSDTDRWPSMIGAVAMLLATMTSASDDADE